MIFLPLLPDVKLAHARSMKFFALLAVVSLLLVILGRLSSLSRDRHGQRVPTHQSKLPRSLPSQSSFSALLGSYISLPEDLLLAQKQHHVNGVHGTRFGGTNQDGAGGRPVAYQRR
jgi:hypothetical protein